MSRRYAAKQREGDGRFGLTMMLIITAILMVSIMSMPAVSYAAHTVGADSGGDSSTCYLTGGGVTDYSQCLPSGRWAGLTGSISTRVEPTGGILGIAGDVGNWFTTSYRTVMPNLLLMFTQICWSSALALSQFAASFQVLDQFGGTIDSAIGTLVDSVMAGGIPAVFITIGIFAWVGAAAFQWGDTKTAAKRILASIVSVVILISMGTAAKTDADAKAPSFGSPWWVVSSINNTINRMTVSLDLDGLSDNNPNMMAYNKTNEPNCQTYLYQMHQQYDESTKKVSSATDTSSVTSAINRIWEETALRGWVTMQYGNPAETSGSSRQAAANAQQAYCHVLEAASNTSIGVQTDLTNKQLGTSIDGDTATYLFDPDKSFIDPWNTQVNKNKDAWDRGSKIYQQRAGVFWETCTTRDNTQANGGGTAARQGWGLLINNLGDEGSGEIKGSGGSDLRPKLDDLSKVSNEENPLRMAKKDASNEAANTHTAAVCEAVFNNKLFTGADDNPDDDSYVNTAAGDAATLGWRFDIPNTGATWREANLNLNDADIEGMRDTLDHMYGNVDVDSMGAFGSMLGAIVNMFIWGAFSIILILGKLMLLFSILSLVVAFLIRMFPIGDKPEKVLKKWAKSCCGLSMVSLLYSVLASIAVMICQIVINSTGMMASSFLYNLMTGLSPALALLVIAVSCKQLGLDNPFSVKALTTMAGGSAMIAGLVTGKGFKGVQDMLQNAAILSGMRRGKGKHGSDRYSSRNIGQSTEGGNDSAETIRKASDEQAETNEVPTVSAEGQSNGGKTDETGVRKPETWADRDPNTIRGSLAGVEKQWRKREQKKLDEKTLHRYQRYLDQGMSDDEAWSKAYRMHTLKEARLDSSSIRNVSGMAVSLASLAMKSKPLRQTAKRAAKTAVKAGVVAAKIGATAVAFSNPITAPLGILMGAKTLTNTQNWRNAADTVKLAMDAGHAIADNNLVHGGEDRLRKHVADPVGRKASDTVSNVGDWFDDKMVDFSERNEVNRDFSNVAHERASMPFDGGVAYEDAHTRTVDVTAGPEQPSSNFDPNQQWNPFDVSRQQNPTYADTATQQIPVDGPESQPGNTPDVSSKPNGDPRQASSDSDDAPVPKHRSDNSLEGKDRP